MRHWLLLLVCLPLTAQAQVQVEFYDPLPGDLIVVDATGGAVLRIDPQTQAEIPIATGLGFPTDARFGADQKLLVFDKGQASSSSAEILRIDGLNRSVEIVASDLPVDASASNRPQLAVADGELHYLNRSAGGAGQLFRVDPTSGAWSLSPDSLVGSGMGFLSGYGQVTVALAACADGLDNDGDGMTDHPADNGCKNASSTLENPQCSDDVDNDGDGFVDWDGGPAGSDPDPNCNGDPSKNREDGSGCGLGYELLLLLPLIGGVRNRKR